MKKDWHTLNQEACDILFADNLSAEDQQAALEQKMEERDATTSEVQFARNPLADTGRLIVVVIERLPENPE